MVTIVISDVHGNLEALKRFLDDIKDIKFDRIICLGDIVGYGPNPNECLELIKQNNCITIKGNHEDIYLGNIGVEDCSNIGVISAKWTKDKIDKKYQNFIEDFKDILYSNNVVYSHTGFNDNNKYPYLNSSEEIISAFTDYNGDIIFYGHTHRPKITFVKNGHTETINVNENFKIELDSDTKYYINVGSIGQQRDIVTDSSYVIFTETDTIKTVEFKRIRYNSYLTYIKIINNMQSKEIATYLIREEDRRKQYEDTFNRS